MSSSVLCWTSRWCIWCVSPFSPVFFPLSSPLCLWHSSHSPLFLSSSPAPTRLSLSLFLCAHISVFPTRLPLCFSFSPCLVLSSPTLSSFLKLCCVLGAVAATTPTSSLDDVVVLSLICLCLLSSHTRTSPSLCHFLHLEKAAANVNSDGHKDCRTPTKYTHTSCLH